MKKPVEIQFGERVRSLRQSAKLTQEQLANKSKLSLKYIQRIEGKNPPDVSLTTICKISVGLNTSPNLLLGNKLVI